MAIESNIFENLKETDSVTISLYEFIKLKQDSTFYELLKKAIWKGARLSYTDNKLAFDDSLLEPLMQILMPDEYDFTLARLQREKEQKHD